MPRRTPDVIRAERAAKKKKAAATATKGLTTKQAQRAKITANRKRVEAAKPKSDKPEKIGTGRWAAKNQAKRAELKKNTDSKKKKKKPTRQTKWEGARGNWTWG